MNIVGTNDAAIITPATTTLTETNAALTTGGTMVITDVDSATSRRSRRSLAATAAPSA
ncbi:MAG: hypothetical protein IPO38_03590 [Rhodocyclaceae bacterium]|nr:hypothetical protein [Rhodocyclaceae bacterium]